MSPLRWVPVPTVFCVPPSSWKRSPFLIYWCPYIEGAIEFKKISIRSFFSAIFLIFEISEPLSSAFSCSIEIGEILVETITLLIIPVNLVPSLFRPLNTPYTLTLSPGFTFPTKSSSRTTSTLRGSNPYHFLHYLLNSSLLFLIYQSHSF